MLSDMERVAAVENRLHNVVERLERVECQEVPKPCSCTNGMTPGPPDEDAVAYHDMFAREQKADAVSMVLRGELNLEADKVASLEEENRKLLGFARNPKDVAEIERLENTIQVRNETIRELNEAHTTYLEEVLETKKLLHATRVALDKESERTRELLSREDIESSRAARMAAEQETFDIKAVLQNARYDLTTEQNRTRELEIRNGELYSKLTKIQKVVVSL